MNKHINIVFTIDDNFIRHFSVALVSVLENNQGRVDGQDPRPEE